MVTLVVPLSDADTTLAASSVSALVRWTEDDTIGAVAGARVESDGGAEDLSWRFVSWPKRRLGAMGSAIRDGERAQRHPHRRVGADPTRHRCRRPVDRHSRDAALAPLLAAVGS